VAEAERPITKSAFSLESCPLGIVLRSLIQLWQRVGYPQTGDCRTGATFSTMLFSSEGRFSRLKTNKPRSARLAMEWFLSCSLATVTKPNWCYELRSWLADCR